jgi:Maltokinase N-terminal cap domain
MAILHRAELHPSKLELVAGWLPRRRWYAGPAAPRLDRVAAFRFDDPAGEVGIETMLVSPGDETVYQVPLSYRGAPLPDRDAWLIGTCEHSVLGRRWVYDACGDPVYAVALAGAVLGGAGQADELVEIDGRLEPREPSMRIASTAGATGAPVIDTLGGVLDSDEITTIITATVVLSVIRRLELHVPPPSAAIPALTGTWGGQPDPVVLALAHRR